MTTLEIIVTILTGTGIVFGALWFIISKSVKFGEVRARINTIEDKTKGMDCRLHEKSISKIENDLGRLSENLISVKTDVVEIRTSVRAMTKGDGLDMFKSKSPLNLTQTGIDFIKKYHIETLINDNWEGILEQLGDLSTTNPYDIQMNIFGKCFSDMDKLIGAEPTDFLKRYAYSIGDSFSTIGMVIGLVIRNKYFEEKNINVDEVDIHDPSKILERHTEQPVTTS